MLTLLLLTLFLGIIWGLLLATLILFHCFQIKCPKCKRLTKVKQIVIFQWKQKTISGQSCQRCQSTTKVNIF